MDRPSFPEACLLLYELTMYRPTELTADLTPVGFKTQSLRGLELPRSQSMNGDCNPGELHPGKEQITVGADPVGFSLFHKNPVIILALLQSLLLQGRDFYLEN